MATSRFIQAALFALDAAVKSNVGHVCSIAFKESTKFKSKLRGLKTVGKSTITYYSIIIDIKNKKTVTKTAHETFKRSFVYKIERINQKWIIEEIDEFVETI